MQQPIPLAHPGGLHRQYRLTGPRGLRGRQLQQLDATTRGPDTATTHDSVLPGGDAGSTTPSRRPLSRTTTGSGRGGGERAAADVAPRPLTVRQTIPHRLTSLRWRGPVAREPDGGRDEHRHEDRYKEGYGARSDRSLSARRHTRGGAARLETPRTSQGGAGWRARPAVARATPGAAPSGSSNFGNPA